MSLLKIGILLTVNPSSHDSAGSSPAAPKFHRQKPIQKPSKFFACCKPSWDTDGTAESSPVRAWLDKKSLIEK